MSRKTGLPKQVKVGWRTYRVTTKHKDCPDNDTELVDYGGMTYHEQGVIWIRPTGPKFSEQQMKETLLHELMHCAVSALGFQHILKEASTHEETDNEENYVTVISSGLAMIFRDNPDILRYLYGDVASG